MHVSNETEYERAAREAVHRVRAICAEIALKQTLKHVESHLMRAVQERRDFRDET